VSTAQPSILDIAPTVAKILGAPAPAGLDGRPLEFEALPR